MSQAQSAAVDPVPVVRHRARAKLLVATAAVDRVDECQAASRLSASHSNPMKQKPKTGGLQCPGGTLPPVGAGCRALQKGPKVIDQVNGAEVVTRRASLSPVVDAVQRGEAVPVHGYSRRQARHEASIRRECATPRGLPNCAVTSSGNRPSRDRGRADVQRCPQSARRGCTPQARPAVPRAQR